MSRALRLLTARRVRVVAGVAAVGTAGVAAVAVAVEAQTHTVEVADDDGAHEVRVRSGTVADALDELDIALGTADEISLDPATEVDDDLTVTIDRAITVDVEVHGAVARRIHAPVATVAGVLELAEMTHLAAEGALISPTRDTPVADGDVVSITLPVPVTVEVDGETLETVTLASTVESVLALEDVEVGPDDIVSPGDHGALFGPTTITIQRVEYVEETEEVTLSYEEVRRDTDDLERGNTRVDTEGREGLRVDTYEVTLIDGEETERERIEQEVVTEPRDRVVLVGTRAPAPPPPPAPSPSSSSSTSSSVWDRLAQCESGGNWSINTGNGYYGGLQFHPQTWRSVGGSGLPHEASRAEQIRRGEILQRRSGWGQWPACSRRLGLS
ncbi:MAG: transglycosylase family protein [Nitriliruptoraceae bacterium]|nr:transglycosylase family protein [Nitriliruptoraceae bacterium]